MTALRVVRLFLGILILFYGIECVTPHAVLGQSKGKNSIRKASSAKKTPKKKLPPKGRKSVSSKSKKPQPAAAKPKHKAVSSDIRLKESELKSLKKEIADVEQKLAGTHQKERNTLERLDHLDRQTGLKRKYISHLNRTIQDNEQEIDLTRAELQKAQDTLAMLQRAYAKYITRVYKKGKLHDTEILLASGSLNQMMIRSRYLKILTQTHRVDAEEIRRKKQIIEGQKKVLENKLTERLQTMEEKKSEEAALIRKAGEQQSLLAKVREDKEEYAKRLKQKEAAAKRIASIINSLVEKERQRLLALEERKARARAKETGVKAVPVEYAPLPVKPISETAFGRLKGRLPWPVSSGRVVGHFGERVKENTNIVTIENGIDISVSSGSPVRSIADGIVSRMAFIPSYGNIVFVNHADGFITVYSHLSVITVSAGQKVRAGHQLGKSGEGLVGPQIHFELWKGKSPQNPLGWLAR